MASTLKNRLQEDMKAALRAHEKDRLGTIRLILAAVKQREVDERVEQDDAAIIATLQKMLKQRRDSIEQFQAGGRQDLADKERFEVGIIEGYLPQPLTAAEMEALIEESIAATGAASAKDMGRVMALLRDRARGRADMALLGARVKERLQQPV